MRYIHREMTVDTHCIDREQVYGIKESLEGSEYISGISNYQFDPVKLDKSLIEIETKYTPLDEDFLIANGHRYPSRTIVTDSAFFQLFHYPLLQGELALDKPTSVLLKKDFAKRIFGKENPIGQTIRHSNGRDLIVEGIIDEPICKSSIQFDMVLSYHLSNNWTRTYTTNALITDMVNLSGEEVQGQPLEIIWSCYIGGPASTNTQYDVDRMKDSIDQAFAQSPYLSRTPSSK